MINLQLATNIVAPHQMVAVQQSAGEKKQAKFLEWLDELMSNMLCFNPSSLMRWWGRIPFVVSAGERLPGALLLY